MDKKKKSQKLVQRIEAPSLKYMSVLGSVHPDAEELENEYKRHNNHENLKVIYQQIEKLFLLMDFYGIDKDDTENRFMMLAYHLALTHETGFKIAQPAGKKKKWDIPQLAGLVATVNLLMINKPMSISNACQIVKDRYFTDHPMTKKTIENKYNEASKNKFVNTLLSFAYDTDEENFNLEVLKLATEMFRPEHL